MLFTVALVNFITPLPLAAIGFVLFSEAVWNTSRVRLLAEASFQACIQSVTTMTFVLGSALGQLWGGVALDRFGIVSIAIGAATLATLSVGSLGVAHCRVGFGRQ